LSRTVLDLFAGAGGLSLGFAEAGCEVLGGVEWDNQLADCYEAGHRRRGSEAKALRKDVRSLERGEVLRTFGFEPEQLSFLVGGPPCQGFSTIGKRRVDDERNQLIFEFVKVLRDVRSTAFLIENVPGLLERGDTLDRLLDELSGAGYENARYEEVDAAACGVPQRRTRVVVFGTRSGRRLPNFAALSTPDPDGPTVWDAIGDLPDPLATAERYEHGSRVPYGRRHPSAYARSLRGKCEAVTRWEPVSHSTNIIKAYSKLEEGETDPATKCWRLIADDYARTLRAGSRSRTACRPVHPYEPRVITVREAARLHSFPDSHPLPRGTSSAHVAIGNSVPPLMARSLAEIFVEALDGVARREREAKAS
jgi:DNA (cytosine-5)-methyltransferase 1